MLCCVCWRKIHLPHALSWIPVVVIVVRDVASQSSQRSGRNFPSSFSRSKKTPFFCLSGETPFTLSYKWRIGGWNKVKFDPLLFFYNFLLLPLAIWTLFLLQILQSLIDTVFNSISYAGKKLWSNATNCRFFLLLLFFKIIYLFDMTLLHMEIRSLICF